MYNRYIPEDASYTPVEKTPPSSMPQSGSGLERHPRQSGFPLSSLFGGKDGLSGLLKTLHLDRFESGDILLLLIMLYLMAEGDDLELVIALGLTLIMGLGDDKKET